MTQRCTSCGARVRFCLDETGTRQILNYARVRLYTEPDVRGTTRVLRDPKGAPMLFYVSHYVSCPNAAQHSQRGRQ